MKSQEEDKVVKGSRVHNIMYTRKNAQVVTTCYQAVTRFIRNRTACSQLLTSLHKLLSTCNKLDDDCRLVTSLFQQVDIVWT